MSDQHNEHESLITTPKQLIAVVIAAFVIPIAIIILLVTYVGNGNQTGVGGDDSAQAIYERIRPVVTLELKDPNGPRIYKTGEQIYQQICVTCHAAGIAGAPKFGDASAWRSHIARGHDQLMQSILKGKGAMPARAGTSPDDISDYELARALVHMVNGSGGKFSEPAPPAPIVHVDDSTPPSDKAAPAAPQ
ncbi:MAG: cytochrome c5 family protein [Ottowia sp.]|nr:cytochrome c5 family protein [Ottowia sp.]